MGVKYFVNNNEYFFMCQSNGDFPCLLTAKYSSPCRYVVNVLLVLLLTCALPSLPGVAESVWHYVVPSATSAFGYKDLMNQCNLIYWAWLGLLTPAFAGSGGQMALAQVSSWSPG